MRHSLKIRGGTTGTNRIILPNILYDYYSSTEIYGAFWDESFNPQLTQVEEVKQVLTVWHKSEQVRSNISGSAVTFQAPLAYFDEIEIGMGKALALENYTSVNSAEVIYWQPALDIMFYMYGDPTLGGFAFNDGGTIRYLHKILRNERGTKRDLRLIMNKDGTIKQ